MEAPRGGRQRGFRGEPVGGLVAGAGAGVIRRPWMRRVTQVPKPASMRSAARPPSTSSGSGTVVALLGAKRSMTEPIGPPPELEEPPLELEPPELLPELAAAARRRSAGARGAAGTVAALVEDRGEQRAVDVVHRARVLLDVRVGAQVLDRLRVAGDRIDALHVRLVCEPVVDDVLPARVRRRERGGGRGGCALDAGERARRSRRLRRGGSSSCAFVCGCASSSSSPKCKSRHAAARRLWILSSLSDGGVPAVMPM